MPHRELGKRAIVIGSGFAGLLSGRVLADYFTEVTIIERDAEPKEPGPRKGVPQGHHIHVLLKAGEKALSDLVPGIVDDLLQKGATNAVLGKDVRWHLAGNWLPPFKNGMTTFFQSRPMLEHVLRSQVSRIDNINIQYGRRSLHYGLDPTGKKVESVTVQDIATGEESEQKADLVLDASGAGTDLLKQLSAFNFPIPRESVVEPDFAYSSGFFEIPENWQDKWKSILIYPKAPEGTRGGAFVPVEGGKWMVTAAGYCGDYPPTEIDGFLGFLKSLPEPDVFNAVSQASLIGDLHSFKFKKAVRRHFEELKHFPKGLLVMGDAVCRANPFFGQGITVAALEAQALQKLLEQKVSKGDPYIDNLAGGFFKEIAKVLDISWGMAVGEDFKYPATKGKRPGSFAITRWFKDKIMSANDPDVANQFYKVMHFVDKPIKLAKPNILYRAFIKR
ncbi:FAD-dependent oxidoreductase [Sneathiella sp. HT1-7]|uniref:FAD-dependent oxidoreductase n=1 Tax=Sneathiella sp. HT1-7 TaxID=2887192 RepID=UPI001D1412F4|nr:FAD-dependent monooxygenase [Sneathiella sp. HT1-7]MCC3303617.1 FAD-dependent monooxygenase [Sneathiella sp. HT1-7]